MVSPPTLFNHGAQDEDVTVERADLVADRPWGTEQPNNRIVAIAHNSSGHADQLADLFGACVAG